MVFTAFSSTLSQCNEHNFIFMLTNYSVGMIWLHYLSFYILYVECFNSFDSVIFENFNWKPFKK